MAKQWELKVTEEEWMAMQPHEKEALIYSLLGLEKRELAQMIAETETDSPYQPNAFFVSFKTLAKMPIHLKKLRLGSGKKTVELTVIPMDAAENHFRVAVVDPWDPRWEHLFYS